jgi:hypothetical protein
MPALASSFVRAIPSRGDTEKDMTKRKPQAPRQMSRKQRSRLEREARTNRILVAGAATVAFIVVAVLGYGYISERVIKPGQPAAIVDGTPIRTGDFESRILYLQNMQRLSQSEPTPIEPRQVLDQMAREQLILQEATRLGLSVTEEEIDLTVEQAIGYDREAASSSAVTDTLSLTATVGLTSAVDLPPMTEAEYLEQFEFFVDQVLNPSGMGIEGYRDMIEIYLLEGQLQTTIAGDISTAEHVTLRYFGFSDEPSAASVVERLSEGEDWDAIAEELEADETGAVFASEVEWKTETYLSWQFGIDIAATIFEIPVGEPTEPLVGTTGRYYVIEVLAREERLLDELLLSLEQDRVFYEWLNGQMALVEYVGEWAEEPTPE